VDEASRLLKLSIDGVTRPMICIDYHKQGGTVVARPPWGSVESWVTKGEPVTGKILPVICLNTHFLA